MVHITLLYMILQLIYQKVTIKVINSMLLEILNFSVCFINKKLKKKEKFCFLH